MDYVHHCPFCSWQRPAASATMLAPHCERCGGTLRAVGADRAAEACREDADTKADPPRRDGTAVFALLTVVPWLLPLLGVDVGDLAFLGPAVLCAFALAALRTATRREPAWARIWRPLAGCAALGGVSSALAVAAAILDGDVGDAGFYVGAAASALLLLAAVRMARFGGLRRTDWDAVVDAGLVGLVATAVGIYFLVIPGLQHGDAALTGVVVLDLAALVIVALTAVARRASRERPAAWWLVACGTALVAGDGLVSAAAAGQLPALPALTAILWGAGAYSLAAAAEYDLGAVRPPSGGHDATRATWLLWRVVLPLAAVLVFPTLAIALSLAGRLPSWGVAYFGVLFVVSLALAFGRQAWLLLDQRRAAVRERRLRREAVRRNEELEALTGLATTMTQTLEEAPIVEQALGVLQAAARATSAALHVETEAGPRVAAAAGEWYAERAWIENEPVDGVVQRERGRRAILRLPIGARGQRIGTVTLVRPASEPFDAHGVGLLCLLVDQMGVAVQNARDYREKLEQAIRDPLTGIYNRRFLHEALVKEVERCRRYGSEASLVIFDVDDFKLINDYQGHAAGDDVLRRIGEIVEDIVRPVDSFARIGGEEFALLLPETGQLRALLVAERVRTAIGRASILPGRRVTVSGGVAACPSDATEADELMRRADDAMYWAKRNGKDLCAVASEVTTVAEDSHADRVLAHLYALVSMIDAQHLHTRDHSENVSTYAVAIGHALGLDRERVMRLRRAALLHDVGKVAVASHILSNPSGLTDEEFAEIQKHPIVGAMMLAHAGLAEEATWVRHHHERADGTGYPDGLSLDEIPFEARILLVADAFEAMTSDRPYSPGMEVEAALGELRRCAGSQFDPAAVAVLSELVAEGRITVLALRREPSELL